MQCPRCQQDNPSQGKFCLECGTPFRRADGSPQLAPSYADLQRSFTEGLERETATSEILQIISSSPTDVQPVFDAVAESAARLCEAFDSSIWRRDGDWFKIVAHHGPILQEISLPVIRGTAGGRAVLDGRTIHVNDMLTEGAEFPESCELAQRLGFRTLLCVPLIRKGIAIGVITLRRTEARLFTDRQVTLLQTLADQAVIAIENVRLFTELQEKNRALTESLEQQTSTSEILRVISSSPTDTQPVFDAIAESAARLCGAIDAQVLRVEGELLRLVAACGATAMPSVRQLTRGNLVGRAVIDRRTIHVRDLAQALAEYPETTALHYGTQSALAVPLMREGVALGVIRISRTEIRPFTDKQITLLQTFADQAVIAIENVRLFKELQEKNKALTTAHAQVTEALEQQTATAEILRLIAGSPTDLESVLGYVAETATRVCGARDAIIYRCDGDVLRLACTRGPLPVVHSALALPLNEKTVTGRSVVERRTIHVHDLAAVAASEYPEALSRGVASGSRTVLATPLLQDGEPLGAILIRRGEVQAFTDKQIDLLKTFADQAVIAIENVRLFTELQEKNRALTQAHAQVTEALDQQTATSEILRVISSSPTDVQPVFDAIVRSASRLCGGEYAIVTRYDGQQLHLAAQYNPRPGTADETARFFPQVPHREALTPRAFIDAHLVHAPDVDAEDLEPSTREFYRRIGLRAVLAVPMIHEGRAIGVVSVSRGSRGPFSDRQITLLRTFADQAVIAIENVRLFTELQTSNRDLTTALDKQTATSDILRVISGAHTDAQPVFDSIVRSAARLLGGHSANLLRVVGEELQLAALTSISEAADAETRATFPVPLAQAGVATHAIQTRCPYIVTDVETDPLVSPRLRYTAPLRGFRSMLMVPMVRDEHPIGVITVTRQAPGGYSEDEIGLLQTFADQAVIAIENVRLFKELEVRNRDLTEALDQQTATSEILGVISSSPTDLQPVFDTIAERSVRLCGGLFSSVYRFDGKLLHMVAHCNYPAVALERSRQLFPTRPGRHLFAARAILEHAVVQVPDVLLEPDWQAQDVARALGFKSVLAVPMIRDGDPIGAIVVWHTDIAPFTDKHKAVLETFADQAVIAIENVRLFQELEARTHELTRSVDQLTALGEVGQAISSTLDLQTVLRTIVGRATQLAGVDAGVIYEYDERAEVFVPRATERLEAEIVEALIATPVRKGEGATGRLAEAQEPIQLSDILEAPAESRVREALGRAGYRALLAVPLVREDHLMGGLTVFRKTPGEFATEVIDLLRTFATQSALAIQNARLFREIEEKSRQLEVASQHKSEFLANMSHELRTPLNAIIGFSEVLSEKMFGELNEKQEEYSKDIHASGQHLLSLINDILDLSKIEAGRMELELTEFHLPTALDSALTLVRERAGRRGIALQMNVDERLGQIQADERKVRQVVLNLLSNAIKFTPEGGRIEVRAVPVNGSVEVSVRDTGVGIAPEDQEAVFEEFRQVGTADKKVEGTGLGLTLCRKFIELHGGRIWVKSQLGVGSTFTFTIPVRHGE